MWWLPMLHKVPDTCCENLQGLNKDAACFRFSQYKSSFSKHRLPLCRSLVSLFLWAPLVTGLRVSTPFTNGTAATVKTRWTGAEQSAVDLASVTGREYMCVCVCVYDYMCAWMWVCVRIFVCGRACARVCIYVCIVSMFVCVCVYVRAHAHAMHERMYVCMYAHLWLSLLLPN